ncbi:hypothetical protein QC823_14930 [Halomonas vilamensis]|uniref:Uncharacterized protein n=1 Tax=Vreelandella vilamensis TaxID=531309 RepID=A0ABU1H7I4_9GAMM|nr:hypothetical protein [Halomonas vilamensis]MDR5900263.1 hypothetical protein [Halomonas vilamensis]
MSIGEDDLRGGFTELEIAAGVPELAFGSHRSSQDKSYQEILNKERDSKKYKKNESYIKSILDGNETLSFIKKRLIKLILEDERNYIIQRYALKERLPEAYVNIIKDERCLEIMIKGLISKVSKISLTSCINNAIIKLSSDVKTNISNEVPYYRVERIQKFIHQEVDKVYGNGSHKNLPVSHMRNLLSTARLYLSLYDISYHGDSYNNELMVIGDKLAEKEFLDAESFYQDGLEYLNSTKKYYPKWRVRHLKHIKYFCSKGSRDLIETIIKYEDKNISEEFQKKHLIHLFIKHPLSLFQEIQKT